MDSVQVACVKPNATDTAFQIYSMKRSAYAAVLRAFCARSDIFSREKVRCLTELRNELKILQTEHAECLVKARSNKQIKSFRAGLQCKGNTCNTEVTKDFLAFVLPDAGGTVFQIHCLERSAYASVLRAFCAVRNHLSLLQVKLLSQLKNELRISHSEHKEVLMNVTSDEHIESLRKFSLANMAVGTKTNTAFNLHVVPHDKMGSNGQVCTSSTSCLSLIQQSPISENSMSSTRDIGISDSSTGAKGPYFESRTVMSAKRLKTVIGHAPADLKYGPSNQLPVTVSAVMVKGCTADTLDCEKLWCDEVESGCASELIFQEKHSQLNDGQSSLSVDHARQESGTRKTVVPEMSVSESLGVMDRKYEIEYQKTKNKDSDLQHGSEIIKLCLTASLLNKIERIFKENPDSANLEKAKLTLKAQENDLLDALAKLSEACQMDLVPHPDSPHSDNSGGGGSASRAALLSPGAAASYAGGAARRRRDWNTFGQYLRNHRPPLSLARCSGAHVLQFLRYLDQFGQTKVHTPACPFFGHRAPPAPCPCPLRQAWVTLDSLVRRLRAAYEENGGRPENNPFGARAVRLYLREVRDHQFRARRVSCEKDRRKKAPAAHPVPAAVISSHDGNGHHHHCKHHQMPPPPPLRGGKEDKNEFSEEKSPAAEVAVSADGGKEYENEVSEVVVVQQALQVPRMDYHLASSPGPVHVLEKGES